MGDEKPETKSNGKKKMMKRMHISQQTWASLFALLGINDENESSLFDQLTDEENKKLKKKNSKKNVKNKKKGNKKTKSDKTRTDKNKSEKENKSRVNESDLALLKKQAQIELQRLSEQNEN